MALGGEPTGSMKAKEQASVVGNIRASGCMADRWAMLDTIGMKMLAVTVLLQMLVTNLNFG